MSNETQRSAQMWARGRASGTNRRVDTYWTTEHPVKSLNNAWVLSEESGARHPLSQVIKLGLHHPRKKERMNAQYDIKAPPFSTSTPKVPSLSWHHMDIYLFLHFKVHILKYTYICAHTHVYSDTAPTNKICRRGDRSCSWALYRLYIHIYI